MASTQTTASGGIGFFGLLTIVFIALKLTGAINWEWKWVLAPLWLPVAGFLILIAFAMIAYALFKGGKK